MERKQEKSSPTKLFKQNFAKYSQRKNCLEIFMRRGEKKALPKRKEKKWGMEKIAGRGKTSLTRTRHTSIRCECRGRSCVFRFASWKKWYAVYAAYACRGRGRITGATEGSVTGAKVYPCALRVTDRWVHARVHASTPSLPTLVLTSLLPPSLLHLPTPRIEYTCTYHLFSVSRDRSWYTMGSIGGTFLCAFLWPNDDPKSMDFSLIEYGYMEEKGRVVIAVAMIMMMSDAREWKDALRDAGKWRGCNLINSILVIAWLVVHSRQCYKRHYDDACKRKRGWGTFEYSSMVE